VIKDLHGSSMMSFQALFDTPIYLSPEICSSISTES
jgi:hypothetical protein